jgi:hypothetical protein
LKCQKLLACGFTFFRFLFLCFSSAFFFPFSGIGVWPAKFLGWRSVYLSYGKDEDCGVGNLWRMNLMYVALAVGSIAMLAAYLAWSIRRGHAKNMRIVEVANYVRNGTKAFIKSF